jgi:hypothetical protein
MATLVEQIKGLLRNPIRFVDRLSGITLRHYQEEVVLAIIDSVVHRQGRSFVIMFPRQSGKNELQAQLEAYLLTLLSQGDAEIIKVSPTWKPQSLNAMRRLERVLVNNVLTRTLWKKERGYIYRVGSARVFFLSGAPEANIVGATASTLLEVDEAQDVLISKFDKDIAPMAASTNATRVFWGTAWTSRTLLARELRAAKEAEKRDGMRRVFVLTADDIAREVPDYGKFVAEQVAKLGRNNPMVKTQFFSEEIDAEGGMFPAERIALMRGNHPRQTGPAAGHVYALLVDVAGEDEAASDAADAGELVNPGRDSTALTVIDVDLSTLSDAGLQKPTYRAVLRRTWIGVKQSRLYAEIRALADCWGARYLVIDATGVGAGLASFLERSLPNKVIPFVFNQSTKSKLGWDFLAVIDSGRWKEYADVDAGQDVFFEQLSFVQYEVIPGPAKLMRWSVPDGTRNPATGELVHDDLVLSAALSGVLDDQDWAVTGPAVVIRRIDPLNEMDQGF